MLSYVKFQFFSYFIFNILALWNGFPVECWTDFFWYSRKPKNLWFDDIFIFQWLNERELVQSIIKLIDKKHDRDTHDNAARLVIEILRVSRDSQYAPASDRFDDPLLNTLESAETVQLLLKIIFGRPVSILKIPLKLPIICWNSWALTMHKFCLCR